MKTKEADKLAKQEFGKDAWCDIIDYGYKFGDMLSVMSETKAVMIGDVAYGNGDTWDEAFARVRENLKNESKLTKKLK